MSDDTKDELLAKVMSLPEDQSGIACLTMGIVMLLSACGIGVEEATAALKQGESIWTTLLDLTKRACAMQEDHQKRLESVALRCRYILGTCRGEQEMKAEANAILELLGEKP